MKHLAYLLIPAMILASCGGNSEESKDQKLTKLKKQRSDIDMKIKEMEAGKKDSTRATTISVTELKKADFTGYIEVQSQINGDENVAASSQAQGVVKSILVKVGQHVRKGQVLAYLDAAVVDQQIAVQEIELSTRKTLYEKQQKLWEQNIGTEVQLIQAKAAYEGTQKGIAATQAQRDMYRIVAPISGVVDAVALKVGEGSMPGLNGIRIVSNDKLKAEANLGENYLGKVHQGDPVTLVFPGLGDSIQSKITYVSSAVDISSRAFVVQVALGNSKNLHPNMSCIMKIANYEHKAAITVPVSVVQKTGAGEIVYVMEGNKAKARQVKTGKTANGQQEILSGLNEGDQVITTGFEDLNDGDAVVLAVN